MGKPMNKRELRIRDAWVAMNDAPGMDDLTDGVYWQMIADAAHVEAWEVCCWCADFPELSGFTETNPTPEPAREE